MIIRAFKIGTKSVLAFLLALSVVLHIATATISGVYVAISVAASAIGLSTVAAREAKEKIADRKATADRVAAERKAADQKAAANRAAADQKAATERKAADDRAAAERKAADQKAAANRAAADQKAATERKATADRVAAERKAADQKAAANRAAADQKAATERKAANDRAAAERKAADQKAADRKKKTKKVFQDTSERVSTRMKRGAARNSAAALGEAIPFFGVAVIAGGLALEVNDACETVKDMKGLESAINADGDPVSAHEKAMAEFNCTDLIPNANDLPTKDHIWNQMKTAPDKAWKQASTFVAGLPELSGHVKRLLDTVAPLFERKN